MGTQPTMKVLFLIVLAIAAVMAEMEAEATEVDGENAGVYEYYGSEGNSGGYNQYPYAYPGHNPGPYGYYRGKRSPAPEAEPEAGSGYEEGYDGGFGGPVSYNWGGR